MPGSRPGLTSKTQYRPPSPRRPHNFPPCPTDVPDSPPKRGTDHHPLDPGTTSHYDRLLSRTHLQTAVPMTVPRPRRNFPRRLTAVPDPPPKRSTDHRPLDPGTTSCDVRQAGRTRLQNAVPTTVPSTPNNPPAHTLTNFPEAPKHAPAIHQLAS